MTGSRSVLPFPSERGKTKCKHRKGNFRKWGHYIVIVFKQLDIFVKSQKKKKYNLSFKSFFVADNMGCFKKKVSMHAPYMMGGIFYRYVKTSYNFYGII